ncbi:MAG: amidase [Gemmataceae bacterium]|nr:amidase [Gemmataceae bacterium]
MNSIATLSTSIRQGLITPTQLMELCLESIKKWEPTVRAWAFLDPNQAMKDAANAERELKAGLDKGPLHGIPIGIKDIMDVNDWPTAAGCPSWEKNLCRSDAGVVAKLRQAGANFPGKTVTTAYASFDPPPTKNPWNLQRTPGGSSSGSAAAIAMRMVPAALGSQTGGSVTRPATYCGVAGFKPTYGWTSLEGILPLAPSMDHVGMLAQDTADLEILWNALRNSSRPAHTPEKITLPHFGILGGFFEEEASPQVNQHMRELAQRLEQSGATVSRLSTPPEFSQVIQRHRVIMAKEAAAVHAYWMSRRPRDYPPCITSLIQEGVQYSNQEYQSALEARSFWRSQMVNLKGDCDALLVPATSTPAPESATTGNPIFNSPWSYTGMPSLSLTSGCSEEKLPLGFQIVGDYWEEPALLQLGKWCENALNIVPLVPPLLKS